MSSGFTAWWFELLKVLWGPAFPRSVINNRDGIIFAFLKRERGCVQVLRYLLGQVSSQKGGEGEAGHPNSHRKKCGRIWKNCPKFFGSTVFLPAGRLGLLGQGTQSSPGLESSGSWCREGLSPGPALSSLPALPWENAFISFWCLTLILCLKSFVGVFLSDG